MAFNVMHKVLGVFSQDIGIDLGTANTVVCTRREGIMLCEPSVVAVKKGTTDVLMGGQAVGNAAKSMLDKVPGNVEAIRPLKHGVVSSFEITEAMLGYFIQKVAARSIAFRPRLVISIPKGITSIEKSAVAQASMRAGAREVYLIEQPMAAALGAGLPISDPSGSMIVDIGGGTTDVAVISLSGIVEYETLKVAGDEMNNAVTEHMRTHYGMLVGEQTAEKIKIAIGSVVPLSYLGQNEMRMEVSGRSIQSQLPARVEVTSNEIREAMQPVAARIVNAIKQVLKKTPPELAADLVDRGISLAGGGAYLRGLDYFIQEHTNLPVRVPNEPLYAVARGTAAVLNQFDDLRDVLENGADAIR